MTVDLTVDLCGVRLRTPVLAASGCFGFGREMAGWLRVASEDLRTKRELARWVTLGAAYARSLPAKKR